jgi:hypothetical protein
LILSASSYVDTIYRSYNSLDMLYSYHAPAFEMVPGGFVTRTPQYRIILVVRAHAHASNRRHARRNLILRANTRTIATPCTVAQRRGLNAGHRVRAVSPRHLSEEVLK